MDSQPGNRPASGVLVLVLAAQAIGLAFLAVTDTSFWIDEFGTARIADAESLARWWGQFINWHDSDMQMPFYHLFMFVWSKAFGFSEFAMRMANWPFLVLAQAAFLWVFRRVPRFALLLILVSGLHPMIWYYLNEARPYLMVFFGAAWTLCGLVSLYARVHGLDDIAAYSPWMLVVGAVVLAGSSMLGAPWAAAAVVVALYLHLCERASLVERIRRVWFPYAVLVVSLAGLALFYGYTLLRGARGTTAFASDVHTLLFSGYELLGLSGLGPGRLELRSQDMAALEGWVASILCGAAILGASIAAGLQAIRARTSARDQIVMAASILAPAFFIAAAGFLMHWRVLGRHFMPALPAILMLIALGANVWLSRRRVWSFGLAAALFVTIALSGISMIHPRHGKDDYRSAAEATFRTLASGDLVWWAAYNVGARYYGVPLVGTERTEAECRSVEGVEGLVVYDASNLPAHCLGRLPDPDWIVLSWPDRFDTRGALADWIEKSGFEKVAELPAFTIWRAPPPASTRG